MPAVFDPLQLEANKKGPAAATEAAVDNQDSQEKIANFKS